MSIIKPYKEGVCKLCRKEGDRTKKMLINNLCYTSAPFHYQEDQKAKYTKRTEKQKEKQEIKRKSLYIELNSGEQGTLEGKEIKHPKPVKIKPVSDKRAKENREYTKKRKDFLEANNYCHAGLTGCTVEATDVHHQKGRIGKLLLDETYWLPVCRSCHSYIETHPIEAKELGLSVSRLNKAS